MSAYSGEPLRVEAPQLASRLKEAMELRGLNSLRKLEDASGVDKNTIQRWLKGHPPHAEVAGVRKVAKALETTAEFLLDLPDPSGAPPPKYPLALVNQIAGLDADALAALERTLPRLRKIVEEIRPQESGDD